MHYSYYTGHCPETGMKLHVKMGMDGFYYIVREDQQELVFYGLTQFWYWSLTEGYSFKSYDDLMKEFRRYCKYVRSQPVLRWQKEGF